jgi:hypothetical protein
MRRMVRFEVEILSRTGGVSTKLSDQCRPFLDEQNIQKIALLCFHSTLDGRP